MFNVITPKSSTGKKDFYLEKNYNKIVQYTQVPCDLTHYIFLLAGVTLILAYIRASNNMYCTRTI